jgi:hypothetical protein
MALASEARAIGTWTQITRANPVTSDYSGNVALLPDGRVLFSGYDTSNHWATLIPSPDGNYANGTWTTIIGTSSIGRVFNPSAILMDGRYWNCGGEFVSGGSNQSECEIFSPWTNTWSMHTDMPDDVIDAPSAMLSDGRVLQLAHSDSAAFIFNPVGSSQWSVAASYDRTATDNEGASLLLPDGSVLVGKNTFTRYLPTMNTWVPTGALPGGRNSLLLPNLEEIGPLVLLHTGKALILGASAQNALYTPPATLTGAGTWTAAANTPAAASGNHGDSPACVEKDGKVLTVINADAKGEGAADNSTIWEYDPVANSWINVPVPSGVDFGASNRIRMLALPNGQVLVSGHNNSNWLYTPAGQPLAAWRPQITSISAPVNGEYTLNGKQLNGLTTGADFGDDSKLATNYPIVSLSDSAGNVTYARTYNVDQMAPRPNTAGSCKFTVPPFLANGTYVVRVIANGVSSDTTNGTQLLQVTGIHAKSVAQGGQPPPPPGGTQGWIVQLNTVAPSGGTVVNLSSNLPGIVTVPSSVTVPAGAFSANFTATAHSLGYGLISATTSPANPQFKAASEMFGQQSMFADSCGASASDVTFSQSVRSSTSADGSYDHSPLCAHAYIGEGTVSGITAGTARYAGPLTSPSFLGCGAMWVQASLWRKVGSSFVRVADSPIVTGTQSGSTCIAPTSTVSFSGSADFKVMGVAGIIFTYEPVTIGL